MQRCGEYPDATCGCNRSLYIMRCPIISAAVIHVPKNTDLTALPVRNNTYTQSCERVLNVLYTTHVYVYMYTCAIYMYVCEYVYIIMPV